MELLKNNLRVILPRKSGQSLQVTANKAEENNMSNKAAVKYSNEFKEEAVKLAFELGTTKAAQQLGIPIGSLNNWKMKISSQGSKSFKKNTFDLEEENRALRKELAQQKKITDLLKKTTAIISQDLF